MKTEFFMPYLFLLIANVSGISKVIAMKNSGKVCPGEYNSVRINTLRSILCALVSLAIFFISGANAELNGWWIWLISGLSNALMMFLWVVCSQSIGLIYLETFSIIGSTAIPMMIAPLLYEGETVSLLQWLGFLCLLIAVVALSFKPKKDKSLATKPKTSHKFSVMTVVYVLLLILSYAGTSVTQKLYPTLVGKDYTAFFNLMTFTVVLLCFSSVLIFGKAFKKKSFLPESSTANKKLFIYIFIAAVMIYAYQYFSTLSAGMLPSAIFYPLIKGVAMFLSAVSDVVIYKQKLTINKIIGLFFVFSAILLINI